MTPPLCTYGSKPCAEPRALKENGELHRLCDFHRHCANEAQRRWHARHQQRKRRSVSSPRETKPPRSSGSPYNTEASTPNRSRRRSASTSSCARPSIGDSLNEEDLTWLSALLLDDDEEILDDETLSVLSPNFKLDSTTLAFML